MSKKKLHTPHLNNPKKNTSRCTYIFESNNHEKKTFQKNIHVDSITTPLGFKTFYTIPFQIYKNNPYWVAPFYSEQKDFFHKKNLFWTHAHCALFIAQKNNKPVGRITAIIDKKFCEHEQQNIGYFGFFDCIDDTTCAHALLQRAQDWLTDNNMDIMRGPIDGRVDVGCGFLYTGFDSKPSVLSTYSPHYYNIFAEQFEMKKTKDILLYFIDLTKPLPKKLKEKAMNCEQNGIQLRPFHRLRTGKEMTWWIDLFLETFSQHWGYVPVPSEEVQTRFGVKQLRWFVDSPLFLVAEKNNEPIAFIWATPEYNQIFYTMHGKLGISEIIRFLTTKQKINIGKLHMIGIKKEYRQQHIASYLNYAILFEMQKRGYRGAEIGWVDEENTAAHATIALTGAQIYKKHRVYEKNLKTH